MLPHLQETRGLAILAVVLFHLWPTVFPNGYLGVDVFFAISGFFMARKLSEVDNWHLSTFGSFYSDRLCRILPLYFLTTAALLLACQFLSIETDVLQNMSAVLFSLGFLKNMKLIWNAKDYFDQFLSSTSSSDLFLHTWSLSVEMQFYIVIPLFLLGYKRAARGRTALMLGNILFSWIIWLLGEETFRFNHLAARYWQFGAGILAHEIGNALGYSLYSKYFLALIVLFPIYGLEKNWATLGVILMVFAVIGDVETGKTKGEKYSNSGCLVFLGNISYSLYLIHWPVVVFLNENRNFGNTVLAIDRKTQRWAILFFLGTSLILSILFYEFFEKWYRNLSKPGQIKLASFLLVVNLLLYSTILHCPMITKMLRNYRIREVLEDKIRVAIEKNVDMAATRLRYVPNCVKNVTDSSFHAFVWYWGVCDYPTGTGSKNVILLGNSYVINFENMIHYEFNGNYRRFRTLTGGGLQVLYNPFENDTESGLQGEQEWAFRWLEAQEADYVFLLTRFDNRQLVPENEWLLEEYKKNIKRLENSTSSRLFLLGPSLVVPLQFLNKYIEALTNEVDLKQFILNRTAVDAQLETARRRLSLLNCSKCEVIDPTVPFLEDGSYSTFNKSSLLAYMDNDMHFTAAGIDALRPVFSSTISRL